MRERWSKFTWLLIAALFLVAAGFMQQRINQQRSDPALGFLRVADLGSNAPPMLAFTTVALGGFRGLIANTLWVRANDLQTDGKYFEMVQLADWITKLQPTFVQVWIMQAYNMAYNISVKFPSHEDRWRWVQRGIELLRDNGIPNNPKEGQLYRELAWFFQHKMGQNMDDAHLLYKSEWAKKMQDVLGGGHPEFEALINPKDEISRERARRLREEFKLDPVFMRELDERYGPLEWRLPDAHAIYWAATGLKNSTKKNQLNLRRVIYQSMHQVVLRGRLNSLQPFRYGPDIDRIGKANAAYEEMLRDDPEQRETIERGHRMLLREAVYILYTYNRLADANKFLNYARKTYPDLIPANLTVEDYALERLKANIADMSQDRTRLMIIGLIHQHYVSLAMGEDDRAEGFDRMARQLWKFFEGRTWRRGEPLKLTPFDEMKRTVLQDALNPETELLPLDLIAQLRTRLGLPAEPPKPAAPR